jgi:hypothetical protein
MAIFLFGDTYVQKLRDQFRNLFPEYDFYGIPGLPVSDLIVEDQLAELCKKNELVIWFCASWFNGIAEHAKLKTRMESLNRSHEEPISIAYLNAEKRYGYSLLSNNETAKETRDFMKNLYIQNIQFYLQAYPNLYICPINLFFYEILLQQFLPAEENFWPSFSINFQKRIVPVGPFSQNHFVDDKANFNESGYLRLKENLNDFVSLIQSQPVPNAIQTS